MSKKKRLTILLAALLLVLAALLSAFLVLFKDVPVMETLFLTFSVPWLLWEIRRFYKNGGVRSVKAILRFSPTASLCLLFGPLRYVENVIGTPRDYSDFDVFTIASNIAGVLLLVVFPIALLIFAVQSYKKKEKTLKNKLKFCVVISLCIFINFVFGVPRYVDLFVGKPCFAFDKSVYRVVSWPQPRSASYEVFYKGPMPRCSADKEVVGTVSPISPHRIAKTIVRLSFLAFLPLSILALIVLKMYELRQNNDSNGVRWLFRGYLALLIIMLLITAFFIRTFIVFSGQYPPCKKFQEVPIVYANPKFIDHTGHPTCSKSILPGLSDYSTDQCGDALWCEKGDQERYEAHHKRQREARDAWRAAGGRQKGSDKLVCRSFYCKSPVEKHRKDKGEEPYKPLGINK